MQCSASFISCYVCPLCTNAGPRRLKRKWSRARHQGQGRAARARLARGYWHQAAKRAWIQPMPDFGIRRERSKRMRLSKAPRHRRGPAFPSPLGRAAAGRATASEAHRDALGTRLVPVAHLPLARFQHSSDSSAPTSVPSPVLIPTTPLPVWALRSAGRQCSGWLAQRTHYPLSEMCVR